MAKPQTKREKEQNIRLPFIGSMTNRSSSSSKDQRFINIFPETRKVDQIESTKVFMNKRPGLTLYKDFGTGEARGCIYFNNKFYVVLGNTVYEDDVTPIAKITLTGSTGHVGMVIANSATIGDYLFICDGTYAWYINTSGTVVNITDTGIYDITVTSGGVYGGGTPTITLGAPGSGAAWTVTLSSGTVSDVSVTTQGSGYSGASTVTFSQDAWTFDGSSASIVSVANNTITRTAHTWATGQAVVYSNGGGTSIAGLTTATTYYIINAGTNLIKLATSAANATAGTAIDITAVGTGTSHSLTGAAATGSIVLNGLPTPHIPTPVFIDGYIALAKNSDIYTCVLDTPNFWSTSDYVSAEMYPDPIKALARQNNQVVALGGNSIEFFYDAANAAGSPLTRNESTANQMGIAAPYALYQNEKFMLFVGQSDSGGRTVWKVEGFQPSRVSDEFVDRILDSESSMSTALGFGVRTMGHLFYVINLPSANRTLVYDVDEKLWHEWSSNVGDTHSVFAYNYACDNNSGSLYVLHSSDGTLCKLDTTAYQDNSVSIITEIVTNRFDMDTIRRKFMSNIRWVGDQYSTNTISVRWTDDDYQTWSSWITLNLTDDFPNFARMGSFRRRAFNWRHTANYPLRGESFEVTFIEGVH